MMLAPNKDAIAVLEHVVGEDPGYAPAWEALGHRYYYDSYYGGGGEQMFQRSNAAYERALALDPNRVAAASNLITNRVERGESGPGLRCGDGPGAAETAERRCAFRAQLCAALCGHAGAGRRRSATRRDRWIRETSISGRARGHFWSWARRTGRWISFTWTRARSGQRG